MTGSTNQADFPCAAGVGNSSETKVAGRAPIAARLKARFFAARLDCEVENCAVVPADSALDVHTTRLTSTREGERLRHGLRQGRAHAASTGDGVRQRLEWVKRAPHRAGPRASAGWSLTVANRDFVAASRGPQSRRSPRRLCPPARRVRPYRGCGRKTAAAWTTYDRSGAARHWRRPPTRRNGISTDLQHWCAIVVA